MVNLYSVVFGKRHRQIYLAAGSMAAAVNAAQTFLGAHGEYEPDEGLEIHVINLVGTGMATDVWAVS